MRKKTLLFVLNPISGGKDKKALPHLLRQFCAGSNIDFLKYETKGDGSDKSAIATLIEDEMPDAVIAVGGDGTVNLVGEVIVNTNLPLGIIPMGSGNGLAKDLNIPSKLEDALNVIKEFYHHPIDTLKLNGRNCFHVSDFGFNARIVRKFSQSLLRGKLSYLWYGLQEFFSVRPFTYQIEANGIKAEGEAFMMAVINGNRFGTNANINPTGTIDDGFFEISIIQPFSKWRSFQILYSLLHNTIHKSGVNKVLHCKKAVIHNCDQTSFHIDGEPAEPVRRIEIEIVPQGLNIIMPCCRPQAE